LEAEARIEERAVEGAFLVRIEGAENDHVLTVLRGGVPCHFPFVLLPGGGVRLGENNLRVFPTIPQLMLANYGQ
jgi:hypothetical protein